MSPHSIARMQIAAKVPSKMGKRPREGEAASFAGCLEGLLQPAATGGIKPQEAAAPVSREGSLGEIAAVSQPVAAGQGEKSAAPGPQGGRVKADDIARDLGLASIGKTGGPQAVGVNTAVPGEVFWSEVVSGQPAELSVSTSEAPALAVIRNPVRVAGEGLGLAQAVPGQQGQVFSRGSPQLTLSAEEIAENTPVLHTSKAGLPVDKVASVASEGLASKESSEASGPEPVPVVSGSNGAETFGRGVTRKENLEKLPIPGLARKDFSKDSPEPGDNPASTTTLSAGERSQGSLVTAGVRVDGAGRLANLEELAARLISLARLESRGGRQELELQLRPEGLGRVRLHTILTDNRLSVQMLVETPQAGRLLQMSLPELRQVLQGQGLQLDQLQVQVDQGYGGGQPGPWSQGGAFNPGRRGFPGELEQDSLGPAPLSVSYLLDYLA